MHIEFYEELLKDVRDRVRVLVDMFGSIGAEEEHEALTPLLVIVEDIVDSAAEKRRTLGI